MKQFIDKNILASKIERRIKELRDLSKENEKKLDSFQKIAIHLCIDECKVVLNILDTFEVKEVDLEKELQSFFYPNVPWGDYSKHEQEEIEEWSFKIAKHFFELGLKAKEE